MGASARSLTTRSIGFGLVNVPVKLFTAQREGKIAFNQITPAGHRVNSVNVDAETRELVDKATLRKGYAHSSGYVIVSEAEIEAAKPAKSERFEIDAFVEAGSVSPVRFDKTYWLGPEKGAEKPYALLLAAVQKSGKVGVGSLVYSGKQHMAMVSAVDGCLSLTTLFYDDEVVATEGIVPDVAVNEKELTLALAIIEAQVGEFNSAEYHDHYREEVMRLIETKAAGQEFQPEVAAPVITGTEDLLAALAASVAELRAKKAAA